ncbi:MAG: hypothetical protein PHZ26_04815 [Candidatus Gracilibacteria bacterium]|nr:hypothetical protein [Candidatus Gracilibacteria bacterium]MDD2909050.1 hypothetical protein [Candidatus Gracilibacteria bacterium]
MTKKLKDNIENTKDNIEIFCSSIEVYRKVFLEARETMEKEKLQNFGTVNLNKLLEIFSEFNSKKQEIVAYFFELNEEERLKIKNVELPDIFSKAEGPEKRAIGEIKAGIENNLIIKK